MHLQIVNTVEIWYKEGGKGWKCVPGGWTDYYSTVKTSINLLIISENYIFSMLQGIGVENKEGVEIKGDRGMLIFRGNLQDSCVIQDLP